MSEPTLADLVIQGLVAFGTIAVAVLAIWGEWIRAVLAPPMLKIVGHTLQGDPTTNALGNRLMYYHLKVLNERPWLKAENCRVVLKGLSKRGPDGNFYPIPMAVPLYFVWAPAEITPPTVTLTGEQVVDFGFVAE